MPIQRARITRAIAAVSLLLGSAAGSQPATSGAPLAPDAIGGTVTSARGAEAGVWVIAETHDFETRFAKIVVTDEAGRYLIPDLPNAKYSVWVRGYGLADSPKVDADAGTASGPHRQRRSGCRHGGQDLSRGVLVRNDENSRGSGVWRRWQAAATVTSCG